MQNLHDKNKYVAMLQTAVIIINIIYMDIYTYIKYWTFRCWDISLSYTFTLLDTYPIKEQLYNRWHD